MEIVRDFFRKLHGSRAADPDFGDINAFLAQGIGDRIELPLHEFVAVVTSATVAP